MNVGSNAVKVNAQMILLDGLDAIVLALGVVKRCAQALLHKLVSIFWRLHVIATTPALLCAMMMMMWRMCHYTNEHDITNIIWYS